MNNPNQTLTLYVTDCPKCRPAMRVVLAEVRSRKGRVFARGNCTRCNWRLVRILTPGEQFRVLPNGFGGTAV